MRLSQGYGEKIEAKKDKILFAYEIEVRFLILKFCYLLRIDEIFNW